MLAIKVYDTKKKGYVNSKVGDTIYTEYTLNEVEKTLTQDGWGKKYNGYFKGKFYLSVIQIVPAKGIREALLHLGA